MIDQTTLADLVGPVERVDRILAGFNSRAFRVETASGTCLVKEYPTATPGERDRLRCEYDALKFLELAGFEDVPKPVARDLEHRVAAYEFVEGEAVSPDTVGPDDIDAVVDFLGRLSRCNWQEGMLDVASEACFSLEELFQSIEWRIERLEMVESGSNVSRALHVYIGSRLRPVVASVTEWCRERAWGTYEGELALEERTLSPSDFGFHNIVRGVDGRFVYLDFEHFGVDDPAKMISDFLLHPHQMMNIRDGMKRQFLKGILATFDSKKLTRRLKLVFPLYGLKWCTILLNEFIPVAADRRRLAGVAINDAVQARQLEKSEIALRRVEAQYQEFAYA